MFDTASAWHRNRYGSLDQSLVDRLERRAIRRLLAPYRGQLGTILDAPAGYGRLTPLLLELAPRSLVLVDWNARRVGCAASPPSVLRAQGDLDQPPLRAGSCDLVVSLRYFQHLHEPARVTATLATLTACSRRLLLLSYYAPRSLHSLQRRLAERLGLRRGRITFSPRDELHARLRTLGFAVASDRALLPGLHAQRLLLACRDRETPLITL